LLQFCCLMCNLTDQLIGQSLVRLSGKEG
jgi:hypothetical protein